MAAILRLSPRPPPPSLPLQGSASQHSKKFVPMKSPCRKTVSFRSSSPLQEPVGVADQSSSSSEDAVSLEADSVAIIEERPNFRGCKTCGRNEIEKGCNGEGRMQGGIATVPGFGWWPIKAFRPCPGFVASGGTYRRRGQSMDEVAFGRTNRKNSVKLKAKSRNTEGSRKLKG